MIRFVLITAAIIFFSSNAVADDEKMSDEKVKSTGFVTTDKTNIDFSETMIDGKMQAPSGFYLQGRQAQSMTQMVRLRSKFRSELRNSMSAVKSISK
jgi:hypothetical protein